MNGAEALQRALEVDLGFVGPVALAQIVADPATRLELLLVRWHEGRALVPAQNVVGLIAAAEAGGWTVRDVSVPARGGR